MCVRRFDKKRKACNFICMLIEGGMMSEMKSQVSKGLDMRSECSVEQEIEIGG